MLTIKDHQIIWGPLIHFIGRPLCFFFFFSFFLAIPLGEKLYLLPGIIGEWGQGWEEGIPKLIVLVCCGGLILYGGERVKSSVYIEDTGLGKNKSMTQLKSNLTLCGFGVRNIKQSAVCFKIKNRKRSSILRIRYNKKCKCFREREMPRCTSGEKLGHFRSKQCPPFGPWTSEAVTSSHLEAPPGKGWKEASSSGEKVWQEFHHSSQRLSPPCTNRWKASKSWFSWRARTLL